MKCMFDGCKNEFVDNQDGLSAMLFHMTMHPVEQINTPEQMFDPDVIQILTEDEVSHD